MAKKGFYDRLKDRFTTGDIRRDSKASAKWFQARVKNIRGIDRKKLLNQDNFTQVKDLKIGRMYMYFYDPKHKKSLPYYDRFPLIFMVGPAKNGWFGLNLHYLPPLLRAKLFDNLMKVASNKNYTDSTKLRISYDILKGSSKFKEFVPCFKRYLLNKVDSKMVEVKPDEWEMALYLPTEQFVKAKKRQVWNDSKKIIKGL